MKVKNLNRTLVEEFITINQTKNSNFKPFGQPQYKFVGDKLYVITFARSTENWDICPNMLYEFSNNEAARKIFVSKTDSDGNVRDLSQNFNKFLAEKKSQKSQEKAQIEK